MAVDVIHRHPVPEAFPALFQVLPDGMGLTRKYDDPCFSGLACNRKAQGGIVL